MTSSQPSTPIADALVLTFTAGTSLADWKSNGSLSREWALYARLAPHYRRIVVVTYGGPADAAIAAELTPLPAVVCNSGEQDPGAFLSELPVRVVTLLADAATVVVKTNQMQGGDAATAIAAKLRAAGKRVGFIARGGYLWSRFVAAEQGSDSPAAREAGLREADLCAAADLIVGTSPAMVGDLAWRYGLSDRRIAMIPNYVPEGLPQRSVDERDPATILYAGQLIPRKRVEVIIEAAALLREQGRTDLRLSIIGEGSERHRLEALARERGVDAAFEPRLPFAEVAERMSRCTVFAHASSLEGHPKTVVEAMATGAPVVVANSPGLGRVVQHGVNGLLVPADPAAFALPLQGLIADEEWRQQMGRAAAAEASASYGLARIVPLEVDAHRRALLLAGSTAAPAAQVRFDPALVAAEPAESLACWSRALAGFSRRLAPPHRARFLASLDAHLYQLEGEAAIAAEGEIHPKHRLTRYHDFFVERIATGQRVLDLGCGVGALAASIAERSGAAVTGMDWSAANLRTAAAIAQQRSLQGRVAFCEGDITSARSPGGFDVVVLSNILEHLKNRPALLRQWRLWYGARTFLIRVPAFDREWRVPWKKELGVEWRLDDTHETEYTLAQLETELTEAGLRMAECQTRWGEYWVRAEAA